MHALPGLIQLLGAGGEGDAEQREPGVGDPPWSPHLPCPQTGSGGRAPSCPSEAAGPGVPGQEGSHRSTEGLWPISSLIISFCFQRAAALGHRVTERL